MHTESIVMLAIIMSLFFLLEIGLILQLLWKKKNKHKKFEKRNTKKEGAIVIGCFQVFCGAIVAVIGMCWKTWYLIRERFNERRNIRQMEEINQTKAERELKEQKEKEIRYEQEKRERKEKVEALKASGFIPTERNKIKVMEIISNSTKTNLAWVSASTRVQPEEIVFIIEEEEDYEIQEEYIINKKKTQKEDHAPTSS